MDTIAACGTQVARAPRWECAADIVVADDCGRELIGRLANISDTGFMAECEEKLRIGSLVEVDLPLKGRVLAEVRWAVGWRFGAMILG
ncbi:PilZ domain-containing protein [Sphingomonas immobilis]|uniref:PilZ domain-containing protein n=1 Tax=Sphingomonas immobilis TaxID=3063997 RepID=A0ABT9A1G7_9SPHN|nr:PilZ domain-containing protein [Sphingomonas sp. CA1-15]MDO7843668.1 PilZ domain-containing protein [Sphingomonas sp. CA1-15]